MSGSIDFKNTGIFISGFVFSKFSSPQGEGAKENVRFELRRFQNEKDLPYFDTDSGAFLVSQFVRQREKRSQLVYITASSQPHIENCTFNDGCFESSESVLFEDVILNQNTYKNIDFSSSKVQFKSCVFQNSDLRAAKNLGALVSNGYLKSNTLQDCTVTQAQALDLLKNFGQPDPYDNLKPCVVTICEEGQDPQQGNKVDLAEIVNVFRDAKICRKIYQDPGNSIKLTQKAVLTLMDSYLTHLKEKESKLVGQFILTNVDKNMNVSDLENKDELAKAFECALECPKALCDLRRRARGAGSATAVSPAAAAAAGQSTQQTGAAAAAGQSTQQAGAASAAAPAAERKSITTPEDGAAIAIAPARKPVDGMRLNEEKIAAIRRSTEVGIVESNRGDTWMESILSNPIKTKIVAGFLGAVIGEVSGAGISAIVTHTAFIVAAKTFTGLVVAGLTVGTGGIALAAALVAGLALAVASQYGMKKLLAVPKSATAVAQNAHSPTANEVPVPREG